MLKDTLKKNKYKGKIIHTLETMNKKTYNCYKINI